MTDERPAMTADELAAELYRRQGYLLVCPREEHPIGFIGNGICPSLGSLQTPLKIVGIGTVAEHNAQFLLALSLCPDLAVLPATQAQFIYRVEAAD